MHTLAIESKNLESFEKIKWFLRHFHSEGIKIIEEEDFKDLQIIREARKNRDTMPLEDFLKNKNES